MVPRFLTALPVYNEVSHVGSVLRQVRRYSPEILVVDDGSTDGTAELLRRELDIAVIRHPVNRGYGAALRTAFEFAIQCGYETLVTIDCDGQHEPKRIPKFARAAQRADMVSGSRYLRTFAGDVAPPGDRRRINQLVTEELNQRLGLQLTDAFCGFKAYRVRSLRHLSLTEDGYAMPLQLWVQAARLGWKIVELPVPLIYLDATRSFGGALDDPMTRLEYYRRVIDQALGCAEEPVGCSSLSFCGEPD